MNKLALSLPWSGSTGTITINDSANPASKFPLASTDLAKVVNTFGEVALYIGGFLMFLWAAWGVFDYIRAEGNKEALAKARKRIQWAIVGFIILILSFFLSDFVRNTLNPGVPDLDQVNGTLNIR